MEALISDVESVSPLEYATRSRNINEQLKARGVVLPPVFLTENKTKKQNNKKNKCTRHPWDSHTNEECRSNPMNKKGSKDPSDDAPKEPKTKQVNLGSAFCTYSLSNTMEGDPAHSDLWIVDSGASFHMTADHSLLFNYKGIESSQIQGSGAALRCVGMGTIKIKTRNSHGGKVTRALTDVR